MIHSESATCAPIATELERRVLAHERILQSLIAYMSRTEPRFVDHLRERFVESMKMVRHEHDYRDVDDYAEAFIRAVMMMGESGKPSLSNDLKQRAPLQTTTASRAHELRQSSTPDRVQMKKTNGIWHVTVDCEFWGDFHSQEQALAAMALAKLSLG
jgi:hypothetical protein